MRFSNLSATLSLPVSAVFTSLLLPMRKAVTVLLFSLLAFAAMAQPTVMSLNQDVSGTYANTTMTLVGAAFKLRMQENAVGTSSGTRNWQFNSDSYFNQWGTLAAAGVQTLAGYNTIIAPNAATASGNFVAAAYNSNGRLPATLPNNYYTYTIMRGTSYASQRMSVLETSYYPVTIDAVVQAAGTNGSRTITITTSGTPDAAENIFVRYSTNSYVASTIVQATGSGTTWTATIPAQSTAVSFYVYSSNRSKAAIEADVTSFSTQEVHDLSTLNLNNNSGSNYSYFPVNVTSTSGSSTSASYATLAAAITAINGGTIHTGTIVCTVNDGYTETAPAGGFSITATGTVANTITFTRSNSGGSRPIFTATTPQTSGNLNDAIFKIIGGDYITIDGFEMRENAANSTTTPGSNNMTEWGVALFYATIVPPNGAQNNTIQNNVITLNRTYANTFGIYSNVRHTATSISSTIDITAAAGSNSGNKIYGNTISNVNMGITFIGCGATGGTALQDQGNDIGGSSALTGNTITNWGGLPAASTYVSNTGTIYGIFLNHQQGVNCSYNTLTSASIASSTATRGILLGYTALVPNVGTFTNTISNNTITITNSTSSTFEMIRSQEMTPALSGVTINMNNNSLINCSTPGNFIGIVNSSLPGTLNMNGNIIRGIALSGTASAFTGVSNTGAVVTTINQNNNQIGNASGGAVTYSVASSGALLGVSNTGGAATAALTITENDVRGITYSSTGSGAHTYINNTATTLSQNISNNTFTNLNVNTTGNVTFISNSVTAPAAGSKTINSNSIVTAFNKGGSGGAVTLYNDQNSSTATSAFQNQNNNFSDITVIGSTVINGWRNQDGTGTTPTKNISGNTFNNWTGGTGSITVLNLSYGTATVNNNTVTNISGQGAITGIFYDSGGFPGAININTNTVTNLSSTGTGGNVYGINHAAASTTTNINANTINTLSSTSTTATAAGILTTSSANIYSNTIHTLSNNGSTSGVTNGIMATGLTSNTHNIYKNNIYNLSTTGAFITTPGVNGIVLYGSAASITSNVYNNLIGDLKAPAAASTDAIRGISVTATGTTSTYNVYYNTVQMAATSSGTNFGTSGIFHTTNAISTRAALNLRNNNIVNTSAANGTGFSVAYRRSSTTLDNYATASNNNNLFGTSGIFTDGTTTNTTLAAYKTLMSTRDQASINENPTWQSTTGSSADFLKYSIAVASGLESGGAGIGSSPFPAPFNDDFTGSIRFGSTGYVVCAPTAGTATDIGAWELCGTPPPLCAGTPAASTIHGVASVCTGSGTNLTLSTTYNDLGITHQWASSTTPGGPYTTTLGTSSTQATGNLTVSTYYICTITCTNSGLSFTTAEKSVLINALPSVTVTPSAASYCTPGGAAVSITATGGITYAWGPATGLNVTNVATVLASPATSTTYTVTVTDANLCVNTGTSVITVANSVTISSTTATPSTICSGNTSSLNVVGGTTATYSMSSATFGLLTATGSVTNTATGDDALLNTVTLPFSFSFFGTTYSSILLYSNGYVAFQTGVVGSPYVQTIPNVAAPDNFIAISHDDLNVNSAGQMSYFTNGTAPNRIFVINYNGVKYYNSNANNGNLTGQVQLFEADGHIEIHVQNSVDPTLSAKSLGIENVGGTLGYSPATRNNLSYDITTPEAWKFAPSGGTLNYIWSPNTGLTPSSMVQNPTTPILTATQAYTVTVSDVSGCSGTGIVSVTVNPLPSALLITATESTCQSGCTLAGGSFNVTTACGAGTTLTYYSDNTGSNPTTTAPTYNQTTPMTIYYACVDDVTGCRSAIQSLTTVPGTCTNPSSSTITATESTCQSGCTVSGGSFNITACTGSTMTFYDDMVGTNPTTTAPTYNQTTPMTIYYACVNTTTGCRSAIQTLTTVPGSCVTPATPGTPTSDSPQCTNTGVTITANGSAPGGETWYWQGTNATGTSTANNATSTYIATSSGTYYIRSQDNTTLCWSVSASVVVTIYQATTGSSTVTACNSTTLNGYTNNPVTMSGAYMATFTNTAGCDSVHTYNVTIKLSTIGSSMVSACNTITIAGANGGNPITTSGAYPATFTNAAGCDSVHTYNVTIKLSTTGSSMVSACNTITIAGANGGNPITSSGAYPATFTNAAGCDSVHTYNVTIKLSTTGSSMVSACNTITIAGANGGNPITSSGAYPATFTNTAGCDSVHTYNVTIKLSTTGSSTVTACNSTILNGYTNNPVTMSGVYLATLTNAAGCDSVHTYNVTIDTSSLTTVNEAICAANLPYIWNAQTITAAGTYTHTEPGANGCDSITTLILTVNPQPVAILNYTTTMNICESSPITFDASGSTTQPLTYRWFKDEVYIADSFRVNLVVSETGNYYVSVKDVNGCKDTSNHVQVNATGSLVMNTNNAGNNSLRRAIECAMPGDTITIDFGLTGMIDLTEPLLINKNLTIGNESMVKGINVNFTGIPSGYGINIGAGTMVKLRNLNINQMSNTLGLPLIHTEGMLKIENVNTSSN